MTKNHQPVIAVNTLSVPHARLGGGFTYLQNLLPPLFEAAPGAQFELLVTAANRHLFTGDTDRVSCTTLDNRALRGSFRTIIERYLVSRWLRQISADLYFVPYGWLPRRLPCPTVWTFQNLLLLESHRGQLTRPVDLKRRVREWLRGRIVSSVLMPLTVSADRIIAVSQAARDDLITHYPQCRDRVCVVHEGVGRLFTPDGDDAADSAVLSRLGLDTPYYLSVSTLMRHKGHASLIKAFAKFKSESDTPAILVIAGEDWGGYRRWLQRLVHQLNAGQFIRFPGHVDSVDLAALYRHARSFALLSTCESFGLPALEAMACGCPTIVANTGGLAEVVGEGGVRVEPDDINSVSGLLHELDILTDHRSALTRAGINRAAQFSWPTAARKTAAVFEDVLQRPITKSEAITPATMELTGTVAKIIDESVLVGID